MPPLYLNWVHLWTSIYWITVITTGIHYSFIFVSKQHHDYGKHMVCYCHSSSRCNYSTSIILVLVSMDTQLMLATSHCRLPRCCPVVEYTNVCSCSCIPVSCTSHTNHCGGAVHFLARLASSVASECGGEPWCGMSCTLGPSPPSCSHWTMSGHTLGTCTPQTFASEKEGVDMYCISNEVQGWCLASSWSVLYVQIIYMCHLSLCLDVVQNVFL